MRSIERMLEPSASAPMTAICLSKLRTFAMRLTVLQKRFLVKCFCDTISRGGYPLHSPYPNRLWFSDACLAICDKERTYRDRAVSNWRQTSSPQSDGRSEEH